MDWLFLFPVIAGGAAALTIGLVIYFLYLKPKVEQPLPNERQIGFVSMWLPRGLGLMTGYMSTAQRTFEAKFNECLEKESDGDGKKKLEALKSFLVQTNLFAQKVGRETFVYAFDKNPLDQKFMDVDPKQNDSYIIHGVQDALSVGDFGGLKFIGVKLDPTSTCFSEKDEQALTTFLEASKYVRQAAANFNKIADLKRDRDDARETLEKELKEKGELRSKLDRASSALSIKPLTVENVAVKGALQEKLKQWFTWPQLLTAAVGYLASPYIIKATAMTIEPPVTTYFAAFCAFVGFFIIPVGKRLFGRWL